MRWQQRTSAEEQKGKRIFLELYAAAAAAAFPSLLGAGAGRRGFDLKAARQMVACAQRSLCSRRAQISCTASRVPPAACRHQTLPSDSHVAESSVTYKTQKQPRPLEGAVWKIKKE